MVCIPLHDSLLSAAMSTHTSQFHVQGTALGRDIYETVTETKVKSSVLVARAGITIAVIIAVVLGLLLPASIIAVGTAIWFSITAAAFPPCMQWNSFGRKA